MEGRMGMNNYQDSIKKSKKSLCTSRKSMKFSAAGLFFVTAAHFVRTGLGCWWAAPLWFFAAFCLIDAFLLSSQATREAEEGKDLLEQEKEIQ